MEGIFFAPPFPSDEYIRLQLGHVMERNKTGKDRGGFRSKSTLFVSRGSSFRASPAAGSSPGGPEQQSHGRCFGAPNPSLSCLWRQRRRLLRASEDAKFKAACRQAFGKDLPRYECALGSVFNICVTLAQAQIPCKYMPQPSAATSSSHRSSVGGMRHLSAGYLSLLYEGWKELSAIKD